ncbi:phosphatidylinositol phosphatase PTPRQ-like, partial [Mizuhopecten yessoensis]|uniref:phosphatidylinositol phosphatase PTPRQ-like n=1 Tax=Mizuhopecten yessoensis TaxID=6573 RepID=UPI000B45ACE2
AGLSVNCNGDIQCADSNAACIQADDGVNNVCRCNSMYFDSNGYSTPGGMCIAMSTLAVTGLTLTKEGTDTVNLNWTPPSEYTDQVNRYEVHWTPSATINGNTFYDALFTTAVQLVGFVPGQTYTFSVRSVESGSRSEEQYPVTTFSTTMKPSTPSGFTATDVDGPQIILSWNLPRGIKTSYDVTTTPVLSPTTTPTESITYTANVLDGQRYSISVTTVSGSERSDPLLATFRTVSKTPDPPTGVICNFITDKTITLTWTAPVYPNGDIQHYVVNSITTNAMFPTSTNLTEFTVHGLKPETSYVFSVATVNDAVMPSSNQSQYSSQMGCWTKAAMSLEPSMLVVSQEQSRQFTLNWAKPTITNGHLRGYRLRVLDGSMCVQEVIFTCNNCTGVMYTAFSFICHEEVRQTVTILPTDLDSYTYTVGNLLPYINYTASVVAVNAVGDGHPNTQYAMTDQEVPQHPTTLTATVVSSTEVNVTWDISDPKPGPTTYTLYIIAVAPESSRTESIPGFSVRTHKVVGLQEYRTYTFNLTASTVKGTALFQQTLPSAKTLAAAPGAVSNFTVARPNGPDYTTMRVSWELPLVLERNSDIVKFMFTHNTTGGNLNADPEEIPIDTNVITVTRDLAVLPQRTYYIEVYAVGNNTDGVVYNGFKSFNTYMAPAGPPPLDVGETVIPTSSNTNIQATQTSFTLTLTEGFFSNDLYGHIEDSSLVLCKGSCTNLGDMSEAKSHDYLTNLVGWKDARANGYPGEYRAMSNSEFTTYLDQASTSGRRKRATKTFVVEIGTGKNCVTSTETYCNGPLEAGSIYVVKAVVCTAGGCTLSSLYGPYSTEKVPEPGTNISVIIGVVCGIVAFAIVIVLVVVLLKRRQSSKPSTYKSDEDPGTGFQEIDKKHIPDKSSKPSTYKSDEDPGTGFQEIDKKHIPDKR